LNYARIYQAHRAELCRICLQPSRETCSSCTHCLTFLRNALHGYVVLSEPTSQPFLPKSFERCCVAGSSLQPFLSAVHPVSLPSVCKLTNRVAKVVFSVYELQLPTHLPFPYPVSSCSRQCSCGDSQAVLLKKMDQHLERVSPFPQQTQLREYLPYNPAHPVQSRLRCRFVRLFLQKRTKLIDIERREYLRSTTGLILHIPTLYHIDRLYISSIIDC